MSEEETAMRTDRSMDRASRGAGGRNLAERGQLLVVFALALTAFIGMVGLVIDGGSTFVQRRDEQNVADAAAMAAGYASIAGVDARATARAVAAGNGFTDGVDGARVDVQVTQGGASIKVTVTGPHQNVFSGLLGFPTWDVSATATVLAGVPNGAYGTLPVIFNEDAFNNPANRDPNHPATFGEPPPGTQDVPQDASTFNWTVFCTASGNSCNGDSNVVLDQIEGNGNETTVYLNDQIGPLNAGSHTTLYDALAGVVGNAYPVAIVDDSGGLQGWAWFHVTGSVGGSSKQIFGWFETEANPAPMKITQTGGNPNGVYGAYAVYLVN
jgi:Flp pilus assembly protein TadG